ncbi:hypothetical protein HY502_01910, partial [Candidatus Woesebacteria bacterium]|nr:hypothetical protein [Candidatus Woesebacteria bacterium]
GVMYGLPVYEGGHVYKVKAVLQKSNGQRIDSAVKDLIVKIPNTWGGSKYPIDPNLPTGEEALANYYFARSEPEPDEPYSRGEPYGPFPTWDFMAGIPPLYMATNSNFFKQRDKFDLRVVDFMKKCGYKVQLSDRATDINQGIDAWLTIGGKEIPIDFKVMKAANVDAFTAYNMPRNNTEFDSNWRSSGNDKLPEDTRKAIAGKLGRGFKTVNDAGFIIPQALPILIDAVQTSERIANGAADEFHHNIDINKMNCMRLGEIIKKAQEVFKPELDSGKIAKSQQTTILEQAAMQRWGGPGYVPIPFTSSVNISSLSQIVPGKTNNLKLAEPDKGGGLFPNLDLNISRPSLSDVAKAAAGAATGGASTWVIVNGARAANGVGYAAGFAVGMTENTYNSLYCGYNAEENCQN